MTRALTTPPVLNPSARTLDFSATAGFDIRLLKAVIDRTSGRTLYAARGAGVGVTDVQGSIISLEADTADLDSTNLLLAYYDGENSFSDAKDSTLQAIKLAVQSATAAIQAQTELTALFVTDGTKFYVRRETVNEGTGTITVTFLNLDGSVPAIPPSAANLRPVNADGSAISPVIAYFDAVTSGTGYVAGDQIARVLFLNVATQVVTNTAWYNLTQGAAIAAPAAANIRQQDQNTVVSGTVTATIDGADPASPAQANAGTGSRGWLATIAGLLKLGPATKASSASVTVATDMANLEPGASSIFGTGMPAGGTGLTGWLSACFQRLSDIAALSPRSAYYAELYRGQISAAGFVQSTVRPAGATFRSFGMQATLDQAGAWYIYGSQSADGSNPILVAQGAITPSSAGTSTTVDAQVPVRMPYYRAQLNVGGTGTSANGATLITGFLA